MSYLNRSIGFKSTTATLVALIILIPSIVYTDTLFQYSEVKSITLQAPAVTSDGRGVLSNITLIVAKPGRGRVFFSALPYTEVDTQGAARIAAYIASLISGYDFTSNDYYVLIQSDYPLIGGPSAGALMTIGFTALLMNLSIYPHVTMTGVINPDGSIGPVGGLVEKIEAAGVSGFRVFLIPVNQRTYVIPVYEEIRRGPFIIRRVRYRTIDLVEYGRELGVDVVGVSNIAEALYYFTGFKGEGIISVDDTTVVFAQRARVYLDKLIEETKTVIENSWRKAIGGGFYGYLYVSSIREINSSLNLVLGYRESRPLYVVYRTIDLYSRATYTYWSLLLDIGEVELEDLLIEVNDTINRVSVDENSNMCTLENSVIRSYLSLTKSYFNRALETGDQGSLGALRNSIKYLKLTESSSTLLRGFETPIDCGGDVFIEVYSNTLGVYTYVSRLLEEESIDIFIDETSVVLENLNNAHRVGDISLFSLSSILLSHAAYSVHRAFKTGEFVSQTGEILLGLFTRGDLNAVSTLYATVYRDAISLGDIDRGVEFLLKAISLQQVYLSTKTKYIGDKYTPRDISPRYPSTTTTMEGAYYIDISKLAFALIVAAVTASAIYLLRSKNTRSGLITVKYFKPRNTIKYSIEDV